MALFPPDDDSQNCYGTLFDGCSFPQLKRLVLWQHSPDICEIQKDFYHNLFGKVFPELTLLTIYVDPKKYGCDYDEFDDDLSNPVLQRKGKEIWNTVMSWFSEEFLKRKRLEIWVFDHGKNTFTANGIYCVEK